MLPIYLNSSRLFMSLLLLPLKRNSRSYSLLRNAYFNSHLYILYKQPLIYNRNHCSFFNGHSNLSDTVNKLEGTEKIITSTRNDLMELKELNSMFEIVCKDLVTEDNKALSEALNWCSKVFQYNVGSGKKNRGLTVVKAYKILSSSKVSPDVLKSISVLGWCVEMLQAFLLICDDIMDDAKMRRGKLCWYRQPDVGMSAVNDSLMLQSGIYKLIRQYFGTSDIYTDLINKFLDVTRNTVYGQSLDMLYNPPHHQPRFKDFTFENYATIVEYKTSYYTFYLPVALAMLCVGNYDKHACSSSKAIALKLGLLFQIQDDYLDCFGDSEVTGKVGNNDIRTGKLTWFAVSLLEQADESGIKEMMENYGQNNLESISKVKKLFERFSLKERFKTYEEQLYSEIMSSINCTLQDKSLQELFYYLLHKTYRRQK